MRLRAHLGVLAIAVLLPVLVFSVIAVLLVLRLERRAAEQQIAETTQRIALSVDRELAKAEASLRVLASSMTLTAGNFEAFRRQAEAADHARDPAPSDQPHTHYRDHAHAAHQCLRSLPRGHRPTSHRDRRRAGRSQW
jgi:hypothetical protein